VASARRLRLVLGLTVCAALGGVLPAAALAGSISGTVTNDGGPPAPAGGIEVCSHALPYSFEDSCTLTDFSGHYALGNLPGGSYTVHFSADGPNFNYVNQWYDDAAEYNEADPVAIGAAENRSGVDAHLHQGGTIAGAVTDAVSHQPVAGFTVCAFATTFNGETGRCTRTDAGGSYAINGLRALPNYKIEFAGGDEFNYQTQYYDGTEGGAEQSMQGVAVAVVAPGSTTANIDAALFAGAEITGTLTEAGTHSPVVKMLVELQYSNEGSRGTTTDAAGRYAFRGLPEGDYIVAFSPPTGIDGTDDDGFSAQYYKGSPTRAGATILHAVPGTALTGIDGEVVDLFPPLPPQPIAVRLVPTRKHRLHCRKQFHKKKVKGKAHCVKVKRHHRHKKHRARSRVVVDRVR
jgi:hypothetical protein